jgi:hypothetical protein
MSRLPLSLALDFKTSEPFLNGYAYTGCPCLPKGPEVSIRGSSFEDIPTYNLVGNCLLLKKLCLEGKTHATLLT